MAQNKGEENTQKDSTEQPPTSQTENNDQQEVKSDKAEQALAKLEAELKAEQQQQQSEQPKQIEAAKQEPAKKPKAEKATDNKTQATDSAAKVQPQVVKSRSWLALFAFILSLFALGAAAFLWWQNQLWLKNQEQLEQIKQQSLLTTQQTLNQQQAQITDLLGKLSQQATSQQNTQQSLNAMQGRIKELGQSQPNYWLAAEANYLINLAERRLLVEQDADTAMQLLLDANMRLAAMQDPSVFHIRTAISEDIAALKIVKQPNSDDIYLGLSGLLSQVELLPFAQVYIPDAVEQAAQAEQVNDNINDWQHNLMVSLKRFFAHFITIRKQETQVQPQLPAEQQWFVRANINTQLLMAQSAVLDKDQPRYLDAIKTISKWSAQYFDQSKAEVVAFVNTLQHLSEQSVELVLPKQLAAQPVSANYVLEQLQLKAQQAPAIEPKQSELDSEQENTEEQNND